MRMKAFPTLADNGHITTQDGMDLRDYFAAKALNGMLSTENWFGTFSQFESVEHMTSKYALEAYLFADAMMEARKDD